MAFCIALLIEDVLRDDAAGLWRWTLEQPSALHSVQALVLRPHNLFAVDSRQPGFLRQFSGGHQLSHRIGRKGRPTTPMQELHYAGLARPRVMVLRAFRPKETRALYSPQVLKGRRMIEEPVAEAPDGHYFRPRCLPR
jgi:hypothetical protein